MRNLKKLRVIVALILFMATVVLFLGIPSLLNGALPNSILSIQFVPSLLKLVRGVSYVAVGFILFTLLALVLGRWYCSWVCPLGILQDAFIRIHKRFAKTKSRYKYRNTWPWLKHVVLVLTVAMLFFGSTALLIWLDPYSNFGRIATHIAQPVYVLLNNVVAWGANKLGFFQVYYIELKSFDFVAFGVALGTVALLALLTHKRGRLFCNTLCPVGAFLGKLSSISMFKLAFDNNKCISCGKCERQCKAESIDFKAMTLDFNRCVTCFNCADVCSEKAIVYRFSYKKTERPKTVDQGKRRAMKTLALSSMAITGLAFKAEKESLSSFKSEKPAKSQHPIMPPGAINLDHYKSTCTACHLCVSACPTNVIQSTFMQFGLDAPLVPHMDYNVHYCQFECNLCGQVCPTGALVPLNLETKKTTQIGKVTFIKENCVVSQLEKDCGACAEHCPTKAVKMVPYPNTSGKTLFIPEVDTNLCIGCGACEHPCPVRPHKAIYVEANVQHAMAQKPIIENKPQQEAVEEEFPF